MKCPNCSFANSDDAISCRVCGYDLPSKPQTPKKRAVDDAEDEALDTALKSLFGSDEKLAELDEEDALDAAMMERLLKKKRQKSLENAAPVIDEKEEKNLQVAISKKTRSVGLFALILIILIIVTFLLKNSLSSAPWKYNRDTETTETPTTITTSETTEEEPPVPLSLGEEPSIQPINAFFNQIPDFVNKGNLNILALFSSSQDALVVLTDFASIGNLEKVAEAAIDVSEVDASGASYTVSTLLNRLIQGEQTQTPVVFDFRMIEGTSGWLIESFSIDTGDETLAPTTAPTTAATTAPKTTSSTTKETAPSTEESTKAELTGFVESGAFSGGLKSTGQDIAFARYGHHIDFDRIVFDIYEWQGGQPQNTVDIITEYTANISSDGKTITIVLYGAIDAYARNMPIDLKGRDHIKSVTYNSAGSTETVTISIALENKSIYKVFDIKSPARLIVDFAIAE